MIKKFNEFLNEAKNFKSIAIDDFYEFSEHEFDSDVMREFIKHLINTLKINKQEIEELDDIAQEYYEFKTSIQGSGDMYDEDYTETEIIGDWFNSLEEIYKKYKK